MTGEEAVDRSNQCRGTSAGALVAHHLDRFDPAVMALVQQAEQGRVSLKVTVVKTFVEIFQLVAQVADGGDTSHARTALERMQVTLQSRHQGRITVLPRIQGVGCRLENLLGFLEE